MIVIDDDKRIVAPKAHPVSVTDAVPEIVVAVAEIPSLLMDGFGPAVVEELKKIPLPDRIKIVDAGLGGPHLFSLCLTRRSQKNSSSLISLTSVQNPGQFRTFPGGRPACRKLPRCTFLGSYRTPATPERWH